MTTFKKFVVVLAVAALGFGATAAPSQAAVWEWNHNAGFRMRGDYGMNPVTHRPYRVFGGSLWR